MRIRPKEIFTPQGEAESRFNKVVNQYDAYYNKLNRDVRTWQLVGIISLIMIILTVIGWFHALSMKTHSLMVVVVNELGRARYLGVVGGGYYSKYEIKDYMIESVLREFLEVTRDIPVDQDLLYRGYDKAVGWLSPNMVTKFRDQVIADDPFQKLGQYKRKTILESVIKITQNTWQMDWYESETTVSGRELARHRYRGILTVVVQEPQSEDERYRNPLGIFIVDYNISEIKEVMR